MTVIAFLSNGSKMVFVNTAFKKVVKQLNNSGLKVSLWRFQFFPDKLHNEMTELAKDIEVSDFEVLSE